MAGIQNLYSLFLGNFDPAWKCFTPVFKNCSRQVKNFDRNTYQQPHLKLSFEGSAPVSEAAVEYRDCRLKFDAVADDVKPCDSYSRYVICTVSTTGDIGSFSHIAISGDMLFLLFCYQLISSYAMHKRSMLWNV